MAKERQRDRRGKGKEEGRETKGTVMWEGRSEEECGRKVKEDQVEGRGHSLLVC